MRHSRDNQAKGAIMNSTENAFFIQRQLTFSKRRVSYQLEILSDPEKSTRRKIEANRSLKVWRELFTFWSRQLTPPATFFPKKHRKAIRKMHIKDLELLKELLK